VTVKFTCKTSRPLSVTRAFDRSGSGGTGNTSRDDPSGHVQSCWHLDRDVHNLLSGQAQLTSAPEYLGSNAGPPGGIESLREDAADDDSVRTGRETARVKPAIRTGARRGSPEFDETTYSVSES
jgi:hypothetical protein